MNPIFPRSLALLAAACASAAFCASGPAGAQTVLASSSFTTDAEGWLMRTFVDGTLAGPAVWSAFPVFPAGSSGSLSALFPGEGFSAPAKFLGNRSAALGGALMFQMYTPNEADSSGDGIRLTNGTVEISYSLNGPGLAASSWVNYVVPLLASAGWETLAANPFLPRTATTDAEMATVLGDLTQLRIKADWYPQPSNSLLYLDNVKLVAAVPEPGTWALMFTGLAGIGAAARRRSAASALLALGVAAGSASAQTVLASSSFDFGSEDWQRTTFADGSLSANAFYFGVIGNPPGSLIHQGGTSSGFAAPAKFLGDQSAALDGGLMFQMNARSADADSSGDGIRLANGIVEISYRLRGPGFTPNSWVNYVVPLRASAGWETLGANPFLPRTATTDAEMAAVLGNLTSLRINADWYLPPADGDLYLDNVKLVSAVPEAPGAAMLALGVAGLAGLSGRRRLAPGH